MLGKVVDHDQRVAAGISEIFRHRHPGERSNPLEPWRTRRTSNDDYAPLGCRGALDRIDCTPHTRTLLADCNIYRNHVARLLVDDCVERDRSLADCAIADNQFALAPTERKQGVDDEESGLDGVDNKVAVDD